MRTSDPDGPRVFIFENFLSELTVVFGSTFECSQSFKQIDSIEFLTPAIVSILQGMKEKMSITLKPFAILLILLFFILELIFSI